VFTARYALSPYIKQIRFVFKGLVFKTTTVNLSTLCGTSLNRVWNSFQLSKVSFAWISLPIMRRINECRIYSLCWFTTILCPRRWKVCSVVVWICGWSVLWSKTTDILSQSGKLWPVYIFKALCACVVGLRVIVLNVYRKFGYRYFMVSWFLSFKRLGNCNSKPL
jgi:hypothetical protein